MEARTKMTGHTLRIQQGTCGRLQEVYGGGRKKLSGSGDLIVVVVVLLETAAICGRAGRDRDSQEAAEAL